MQNLSQKEMANCITELKTAIKFLTLNTDRLLEANKLIMGLEQDIFHEKWKVRYLTRRLKAINPHEAVTEEELDAEIKGGMN
jgi:hypothetical protein